MRRGIRVQVDHLSSATQRLIALFNNKRICAWLVQSGEPRGQVVGRFLILVVCRVCCWQVVFVGLVVKVDHRVRFYWPFAGVARLSRPLGSSSLACQVVNKTLGDDNLAAGLVLLFGADDTCEIRSRPLLGSFDGDVDV